MLSNLKSARARIETLRLAVLTPDPEEIDRCVPDLDDAIQCLRAVELRAAETSSSAARPELRVELTKLRNELRIVARLIEHGAAFHRGWAKLLGSAAAGYTPGGEPAPLDRIASRSGSVSLRG